jgi:hypothetical protein
MIPYLLFSPLSPPPPYASWHEQRHLDLSPLQLEDEHLQARISFQTRKVSVIDKSKSYSSFVLVSCVQIESVTIFCGAGSKAFGMRVM